MANICESMVYIWLIYGEFSIVMGNSRWICVFLLMCLWDIEMN